VTVSWAERQGTVLRAHDLLPFPALLAAGEDAGGNAAKIPFFHNGDAALTKIKALLPCY
jgi:hypothetical protein